MVLFSGWDNDIEERVERERERERERASGRAEDPTSLVKDDTNHKDKPQTKCKFFTADTKYNKY